MKERESFSYADDQSRNKCIVQQSGHCEGKNSEHFSVLSYSPNVRRAQNGGGSKYHIYIFQGFRSRALSDGHEKRGKWEIYISRMKRSSKSIT